MNGLGVNHMGKEEDELIDYMESINLGRGGSVDGLRGFYEEPMNAYYNNKKRKEAGIKARECVIDNNGNADAVIKYANGQKGREIQYKSGYQYSRHKKFLESGKYDGMIYYVNQDNPIFSNPKQMKELEKIAKKHNIKIQKSDLSSLESKMLVHSAHFEGNIKSKIGAEKNAKVSLKVYKQYLNGKNIVEDTINKGRAFNEDIAQKTSPFMSENHAKINKAGVSNALASAEFAAAFSVAKNAMSVIRDEKDGEDAAKEVLKDTVSAGVLGYVTGAISEAAKVKGLKENRTALLVNGTIQITKQIYSYVNSDIDEKQLVQNIAETTAYLTAAYAGRIVGEAVGMAAGGPIGAAVGQYVGEMITTAVCSTIIDTIHREQQAIQYNKKMLALAHRAEREIRESQGRLQLLVNKENERFIQQLDKGYDQFMQGVIECNYSMASSGLGMIAKEFNIEQDKLTQGHVTKGNIFGKKNRVIKM